MTVEPSPDRAATRFVVSGRVQGVGFRWHTLRIAERLGLAGWVSNLPDGRVEVVASGSAEALSELELGIRAGPRLARVENVEKSQTSLDISSTKSFIVR